MICYKESSDRIVRGSHRDNVRNSLDALPQHIVRHAEGLVDGGLQNNKKDRPHDAVHSWIAILLIVNIMDIMKHRISSRRRCTLGIDVPVPETRCVQKWSEGVGDMTQRWKCDERFKIDARC